jgi:hypothetical protein
MNKEQWMVVIIVVTFVVVGIFLYFVFSVQRDEEMLQTGNEYGANIVDFVEENVAEEGEKETAVVIVSDMMRENEAKQKTEVVQKTPVVTTVKTTPETGPGSTAAIIAVFAALGAAFIVQRSMQKAQ